MQLHVGRRASVAFIGVAAIVAALVIPATSASADDMLVGVDQSGPAWVDDSIAVPVAGVPYSDSMQSPPEATNLTIDADGPYGGGGYLTGNPPGLHTTITDASGGGFLITISGTPTQQEGAIGQYNINYSYVQNGVTDGTVMRLYWSVDAPLAATTTISAPSILPSHGGAAITATVTSASSGVPKPTGTVQFKANGANVGSAVTPVDGVATAPSDLSAYVGSTASITAHFNGDGMNGASDSGAKSVYVYGASTISGVFTADGTPVPGANALLVNSSGTTVDTQTTSSSGRYTLTAPVTDQADAGADYRILLAPTSGGSFYYLAGHTPSQANVTSSAAATQSGPNDWNATDYNVYDSTPPHWSSPSSTAPQARVGSAYTYTVAATGDGPISYTVTNGELPFGLSLAASTGVISGTPASDFSESPQITATTPYGSSATILNFAALLPEQEVPAFYSTSFQFQQNEPITPTVLAYGDATLVFSVSNGALPAGISLDTATGILSGMPTATGPYAFTISVHNDNGSPLPQAFSGTVAAPYNPPVWSAASTAPIQIGVLAMEPGATSAPITVPGSPGPVSYELLSGTIPVGLSLDNGPDGNPYPIEGYPTTTGSYDFTIRAYNNDGHADREFSGSVHPAAGTVSWPDGAALGDITVGSAFSQALAADGSGTITYSLNGGEYPHGLTMTSAGVISGTPPSTGSYNFSVKADNGTTSAIQAFIGNINAVNSSTTVSAPAVANAGDPITLGAAVTGYGTLTNYVEFKINGTQVGTGTVTDGAATWTGALPDGVAGSTISVSAVYIGDDNNYGSASTTDAQVLIFGSSSVSGAVSSNGAGVTGATVDLLDGTTIAATDTTGAGGTYALDLGEVSTLHAAGANYIIRATLPDGAVLYYAAAGGVGEPAIDSTGAADATGPIDWTPTSSYVIYENIAPTFVDETLATPRVGEAYSDSVSGDGTGALDYSFTGTLPSSLTFAGGTLSGTPTAESSYDFTVTISDLYGSVSKEFSDTVLPAYVDPYWTDNTLAAFRLDDAYSDAVAADGDATIVYTVIDGDLPDGITLDGDTGTVSGTPTSTTDYDFTIRAANGRAHVDQEFSGSILPAYVDPTWTSNTLPDFRVGEAYDATVTATGDPTITYVLGGALPDGIALDAATGEVTGTPTTAATYSFSIEAENSHAGVPASYSGTVLPAYETPVWTDTTLAVPQTSVAYSDGVAATADGSITYGVSAGTLPAGLTIDPSSGAVAGTPTGTGAYSFTLSASTAHRSVDQAFSGTLLAAPDVSLTPQFAAGDDSAGATFTVSATGVGDAAAWTATLHSRPTVIASGAATGGAFSAAVTLPSGIPAGAHFVIVSTMASDGSTRSGIVWFTVLPSGAIGAVSLVGPLSYVAPTSVGTARLPMTGVDATDPLALALALLLAGAAVIILRRRRRA